MLALKMVVDLAKRLSETGAVLHGHFRLSSGLHSADYVQCARLLEHPRDARQIGALLAEKIRPLRPELIVSPALGGIVIGYAVADTLNLPMVFTERKDGLMSLRRGFSIGSGRRVVIVEDVVTTGKSSAETSSTVENEGGIIAGYAAILNRSGRDNPFGDVPFQWLMALSFATHSQRDCPLCRSGVPLDTPGSRFAAAR